MQQLELFDYRKDYLFDNKNQIAHWYDILKETEDTISYAEHIDPNKGYAIAGMEYEEYVDVKKDRLKGLTYDQILAYLKSAKKEDFKKCLDLNFFPAIEIIQNLQDNLKKNKGSIVLFSTVAVRKGFTNHAIISSAKGAIEGLTVSLAAEFAGLHVSSADPK